MLNGCICCSVRQDLVVILEKLARRVQEGSLFLDAIVIETTGMADPAPVAPGARPTRSFVDALPPQALESEYELATALLDGGFAESVAARLLPLAKNEFLVLVCGGKASV